MATLVVALAVLATTANKSVTSLPVVHASSGCSVSTLASNYGFMQPSGFITPLASKSVQGNEVDGAGNVSNSCTAVINGNVFTNQTGTGTYTVNSSCTGSVSFTGGDAAGNDANVVIVGGGTEVFGIVTNAVGTASFDNKKQ